MNAVRKLETNMALLELTDKHIYVALEKIEARFEKIDSSLTAIHAKIDSNYKWLIGLAVSVFFSASTLALSVYQFFK